MAIDIIVNEINETVEINATPNVIEVNVITGGGAISWGDIEGNLTDQTDLQNALNSKANLEDIPTLTSELTNDSGFITNVIDALGFTPENVTNKAIDFITPNNTKYPTTQAVITKLKETIITVELIDLLTVNFYAPNDLRINSTALITGTGTITLKVNDVAYTLGALITQGDKITVETTTESVYNLIGIYE